MIALNIIDRPYSGLLLPLKYDQSAPFLWLLVSKAVTDIFGHGEIALRLLPFACGVSSLLLFSLLAYRHLSLFGAAAAIFLFSVLNSLVYYSGELKQYSVDVLVTVLFMGLLLDHGTALLRSGRGIATLLGLGVAAVLFSHAATFVLLGVGGSLFIRAAVERDRRGMAVAAVIGLVWLAVFAGTLKLVASDSGALIAAMRKYWSEWFLPLDLWNPSHFADAVKILLRLPEGWGFPPSSVTLIVLLSMIGFIRTWRRTPILAVFFVTILAGASLASMLQFYPMTGRFILFLAPAAIYLMAAGLAAASSAAPSLRIPILFCGVLVIGLVTLEAAWQFKRTPAFGREELNKSVAHVAARRQPGDAVYVYYAAVPAFRFYGEPLTRAADGPVVYGRDPRADWNYMLSDFRRICGHRVWFVWSHRTALSGVDEIRLFEFAAANLGRVLSREVYRDAGATLLDLTQSGDCSALSIREPARPWIPDHPGFRPDS
ncbi:hypothetical protein [Azospirillum thermophilum]|nr:hypothetical protein [Azospirillum thermophilum]